MSVKCVNVLNNTNRKTLMQWDVIRQKTNEAGLAKKKKKITHYSLCEIELFGNCHFAYE